MASSSKRSRREEEYELRLEHDAVELNKTQAMKLHQPLAALVLGGGFQCDVLEDGTEVFQNADAVVTVPRSCVRWLRELKEPVGPTEMNPEREKRLRELTTSRLEQE